MMAKAASIRLKLLQSAGIGLTLLGIAIVSSYLLRKSEIPSSLENIPTSSTPDTDAERMYVAMEEGRPLDAFKFAMSLNPISVNGNANMITGMHYTTGILDNYREDHCKAAIWYDRAARFKQVMPAIYISIIYMSGQGVKRDAEAAYFWYLRAKQLANTYPTGQWPDLDWSRYIRGLELALEAQLPEIQDPVKRAALDEKLRNRTIEQQAPPKPLPVPDIPIFSALIGQLFYDTTGCHGPQSNGFAWFDSQYRAEQLGFKPAPRRNIGDAAGLNVQF